MPLIRAMKVQLAIKRIARPTADALTLWFDKPPSFSGYSSGQHVSLTVSVGYEMVGRKHSFNSSPYVDEELSLTIRLYRAENFRPFSVSMRGQGWPWLWTAHMGTLLSCPNESDSKQHIMFAGGSGITPIFSMIRSVLKQEPKSSISLIYSNRSYSRIIFNTKLRMMASECGGRLEVYHVITRQEYTTWFSRFFYKGRLSKLIAKKILKNICPKLMAMLNTTYAAPTHLWNL